MNGWTPLWSQVVESTLWEEPLEVRVLFLTMLAIKEPDHVVRMPFRRLVKKAHMPPDQVQTALDVLMAPDTRSVDDQAEDGRRLKKVDDGWFVINGEHYRKEMQKLMTRIRKNNWQRENRKAVANLQSHQGPTASENHFDRNFDPSEEPEKEIKPMGLGFVDGPLEGDGL